MAGIVKEMSLIKQVLQLKFYDHLKQNLVAQKDVTTVLAQTYKPGEKLMIVFEMRYYADLKVGSNNFVPGSNRQVRHPT